MNTGIIKTIGCLLGVGVLTFLIWCTVLYYQKEYDYDNAWQDGYDTALPAKDVYENTIKELQAELSDVTTQYELVVSSNESYKAQVEQLTAQKTELESSVATLTQTKTENEQTIASLTTQVDNSNKQVEDLTADLADVNEQVEDLTADLADVNEQLEELQADAVTNASTIAQLLQDKSGLENQITNLNSEISTKTQQINTLQDNIINLNNLISQLQSTNELQAQTISNLNAQIVSLNTQISNLTLQINNNSGLVSTLNQKITQLENSIAYYEEYIAGLETGTQIVITAEFNGSVYNVQVINKGGKVSLVEPTSTDYVIFNYWQLEDGTQIDLSTYTFNESTKIIANVTYKYDVDFYVDNVSISDDIIVANSFATAPSNPSKSGYEFDGWSLDGSTVLDVSSYAITKNTIFYAVFAKLHTVQFDDGTKIIDTQTVRNGEYAEDVEIEDTTYKIFVGWMVAGSIVDVESYVISYDTVFTASYTYKYDVTFMSDSSEYDTQIVTSGNYATEPEQPTKTGYTFLGWSINGSDIVSVTSISITANTTFLALWQINSYVVQFDDGTNIVNTQSINYGGYATAPATPTKTGYLFKGWSLDGSNVVIVTSTAITQATTFVALWDKTYVVTYYNEDNITEYDTVTVISGNELPDADYTPTTQNMKFAGWSLDKQTVIASDYTVTSDIALYPIVCDVFTGVWTYSNYTLTIYSNGAMTLSPSVPNFWFAEATRTLHISNGDDMEMDLYYDAQTNTLTNGSYVWTNTTNYITGDDVSIEAGRYETEDGKYWINVSATGELSHCGFSSITHSYTYGPSKYVVIGNEVIGNGIGFTFEIVNETTIRVYHTGMFDSYNHTLILVS